MLSQLLQVMLSAMSAGSTCSLCGASAGSAFLAAYVITHERFFLPCMSYLAGKACMTMLLCGVSASVGQVILDSSGKAFGANIYMAAQIFVLVVCVIIIVRGISSMTAKGSCCGADCRTDGRRGRCQGDCGMADAVEFCSISSAREEKACGNDLTGRRNSGAMALLVSGLACGATPCAPLLLVLGQCVTLSVPFALVSGMVFSTVGFLSPVLIWFVISRLLAGRLRQDAAQYLIWFRLGCYVLLLAVTVYTIFAYMR